MVMDYKDKEDRASAFSSELEGAPPSYKDYDQTGLAELDAASGQQNATSPPQGGPPPEGALESGEQSPGPSIQEEPAMDLQMMAAEATPEDAEYNAAKVEESYAGHGLSLEGATGKALKDGGPQAWALAAKWGLDLEPFANKAAGAIQGAGNAVGGQDQQAAQQDQSQAFGNAPTDDQVAAGGPVADTSMATEKNVNEVEKADKKQKNRVAMGYFLTEMGLKILASNRPDAAGAIGDAGNTMIEQGRARAKDAATEKLASQELKRKTRREDEADTMARAKEKRDQSKFEQQSKEDQEKAERDALVKITDKDGEVVFAQVREGNVVYPPGHPNEGEIIRESTQADLSASQIETSKRHYENQIDEQVKAIKKEIDEGVAGYEDIEDLPQDQYFAAIKKIAEGRVNAGSKNQNNDIDPLGLLK